MADNTKTATFMQRILTARKEIAETGISKDKSGFKFKYVDLPQIEQKVNEACFKNDIFCWFDFNEGRATLSLFDALDLEKAPFSISITPNECKSNDKNNPIQDTGAMMTYMRRYLYMSAFQISEHDRVDSMLPEQPEEEPKKESQAKTEEASGIPFPTVENEKIREMLVEIRSMDESYIDKMLQYKNTEDFNALSEKYVASCLAKLKEAN